MTKYTEFELRRLSDDLIYNFDRREKICGESGYQRRDMDLWIIRKPGLGWVAWDDADQSVTGRPWDILPEDQTEDHPPEGIWVSRKGIKSYVYRLVYI